MGTNRRAWTAKEDMILRDFVETHGEAQWASLPVRAGLKRRGKSCRLRWFNYLRPNIKRGNISADEDDLIIRLHRLLGNRWSLIAKRLPGRTDNEIKNYWNTHLRKKLEKDGSAHKLIPKPIESDWNAHNNNVPTNVDDHKTYKAAADGSHATGEIMSTPSANRVSQSTPVLCPGKTNRECLHSELDTDLVDKSAADEVHEPKSLYETQLGETYFEQEWQSSFMPLASSTDFPFLYQDFAQPDLLLAGKTNSTQNIIYSPDCGLPFFTADSSLDLLLQKLCTDNL